VRDSTPNSASPTEPTQGEAELKGGSIDPLL
jgi:hypothetical protein